jgi:antirestriction protein ArdC
MNQSQKRDHRQEVTDGIVRMLEEGVAPWQKPWQTVGMPFNATTDKPYRGGNAVHLLATATERGYQDPRWMTYRQAAQNGWQVRKGEKGTRIEFWEIKTKAAPNSEEVEKPRENLKPQPARKLIHRIYTVFNARQIEGVAPYQPAARSEFEVVQSAERILQNSGVAIAHDQRDRAFYSRSSDSIHLPPKEAFTDAAGYYGTALHEIAHWSGHPQRLNRATLTESYRFGDTNYAKEELRAELASVFLAAELGVPHDPANHAAYVGAWIKTLKEDKNEIFRAAHDASAATDFVLALDRQKDQGEEFSADLHDNEAKISNTRGQGRVLDKIGKFFGEYEFGVYREEKDAVEGAVWKVKSGDNCLGYLKAMNARGNHIFVRPSFEKEPHFMMCDDLSRQDLDIHHKVKGQWKPGRMVVETSPENYQVWIRTDRELTTDEKKYWLERLNSDPGASPLHRWGRCPGFRNRKEKHLTESGYPLAKLVWVDWQSKTPVPEVKIEPPEKELNFASYPTRTKDERGLPSRADFQKSGQSETDFAYAMALLRRGLDRQEVKQRILAERNEWDNHKGEKKLQHYLETTVANAEKIIGKENHYRNLNPSERDEYLKNQAKRFAAKVGNAVEKGDALELNKALKIEMDKGR